MRFSASLSCEDVRSVLQGAAAGPGSARGGAGASRLRPARRRREQTLGIQVVFDRDIICVYLLPGKPHLPVPAHFAMAPVASATPGPWPPVSFRRNTAWPSRPRTCMYAKALGIRLSAAQVWRLSGRQAGVFPGGGWFHPAWTCWIRGHKFPPQGDGFSERSIVKAMGQKLARRLLSIPALGMGITLGAPHSLGTSAKPHEVLMRRLNPTRC